MLSSAYISHFKSISEARIKFNRENVIVGPNGSGKSNVVDALYFVRDATQEDLEYAVTKRHGIESIRQWSRTKPYHIGIELSFKNGLSFGSYRIVISSARGAFKVEEEAAEWYGPMTMLEGDNSKNYTRRFHRDSQGVVAVSSDYERLSLREGFSLLSSDSFLSQISGMFSLFFFELKEEVTSFSAYAIYPNTIRTPQSVSNDETLSDNGSNLASVIKRMTSSTRRRNRESLVDALRVVLPIVDNIEIRSAGGFYVPVLRVREPSGDLHDLNMSQISDGTLRMLGLLTAFYQPSAPHKIALEEPEQMIHPGLLAVLVDAARDYTGIGNGRNNQLFLTTHSPNLLDHFHANDIIRVQFKDGVTTCGVIQERQKKLINDSLFSAGELLVAEGFLE